MTEFDRILLAVRLCDETGLRLRDALALPPESFDPGTGSLHCVLRQGAACERRVFRLSRLLAGGLRRMLAESGGRPRLFSDAGGGAWTLPRVRTVWGASEGARSTGSAGQAPGAGRWQDDRSSSYVAALRRRIVTRALGRVLAGRPRPRVVEIGCGYGELLHDLAARGPRTPGRLTVGVDCVAKILGRARAGSPSGAAGLEWIVADAARLPLAKASCDAVLCIEVLEHFPVPRVPLTEVARVLRPGGALIATTPSPEGWFVRAARLRQWWRSFGPQGGLSALRRGYVPMIDPGEIHKEGVFGHVSALTPAGWRRVMRASGLFLRDVHPISLATPHRVFDRHPAALGGLRSVDSLLLRLAAGRGAATELAYVAERRDPV